MHPSQKGCRKDAHMRRRRMEVLAAAFLLSTVFVATVRCAADAERANTTAGEKLACPQPSEPRARSAASGPRSPNARTTGGGYPGRRIAQLVERAGVIVRGTVESVEALGDGVLTTIRSPEGYVAPAEFADATQGELQPDEYAVSVCRAEFHVISVLKGSAAQADSTIVVDFYLPYLGPVWAALMVGQHGLLLLDGNGNLADLFYPLLPISPAAPNWSSDLPPLDAVGQYLLLSLRPDTFPATLESCLDGALDLGIAADAAQSLRSLAASNDPAVRGIGLRGLVEIKDPRSVPDAVAYLLSGTAVPAMPQVPIRLAVAIGTLDDPSLAQAIMPLLSSPNSVLRGCAVQALRRMKNPAAIPALVGALADPDQSIQYGAMMGIAETVGAPSEWLPSRPLFEEAPRRYLDHWLLWWDTEGQETALR